MAAQLRLVELVPGLRGNVSVNDVAEEIVRDPDRGRLAHPGDPVEDLLDLAWDDLLATGLEDIVAAADEVEEAVLVASEQVAGHEHALGLVAAPPQLRPGQLLLPPVAVHDMRAANHELAGFPRPQLVALGILDPGLRTRNRQAGRRRPAS